MAELRAQARRVAVDHGFADARRHDLTTAAREAAMNAAVHRASGGGGSAAGPTRSRWRVRGRGTKLMLAATDKVWLLTGSTGTTVVLEQDRLPPAPKGLEA